ncbi:Wzz/FepE/Etk N-terminal domain-containing protein [Dyella amyloliquefaciens]|uniref:Wzz/FepE/Etk N-terminal domain-containing protein n=1 Tax=Dyella amyloliquefaciens TaxID=1770545 RepID=UPI001E3B1309|nr:Wzz/FepE/Etk N-terminal domain-containing protein [Dyella amyloliquefaciens]
MNFNKPVTMERDEIYLIDMWRILVREWKWCLAVLVLVLAGTYAFAHLARRQWEASAWILIGQVGQVPQGQDPKVEPIARVLERLQTTAFQNDVTGSLGLAPASREAQLYRKSLKLEPLPYAGPMVRVNVRGESPAQARQFAEATVAQLRAVHRGMEATPLSLAHARLDEVQTELKEALADRDRLLQAARKDDAGGKDASLVSVLLASKSEDIRNLQMQQSDLAMRLSPNFTYETSLPWPAYVPERQAFPNPVLTYGIGLLAGLGLGAFAGVARNAARRRG